MKKVDFASKFHGQYLTELSANFGDAGCRRLITATAPVATRCAEFLPG